jgi:hypothetical protein
MMAYDRVFFREWDARKSGHATEAFEEKARRAVDEFLDIAAPQERMVVHGREFDEDGQSRLADLRPEEAARIRRKKTERRLVRRRNINATF